jgi:hypothetical protein
MARATFGAGYLGLEVGRGCPVTYRRDGWRPGDRQISPIRFQVSFTAVPLALTISMERPSLPRCS